MQCKAECEAESNACNANKAECRKEKRTCETIVNTVFLDGGDETAPVSVESCVESDFTLDFCFDFATDTASAMGIIEIGVDDEDGDSHLRNFDRLSQVSASKYRIITPISAAAI
jgi:hypothetical protein